MIAKGTIIDIIQKEKITNVVIKLKIKDTNRYTTVCFTAFSDIQRLISTTGFEKGDMVKITYSIFSKKFPASDSYFTTLSIQKIQLIKKQSNQLSVDLDGNYNQYS